MSDLTTLVTGTITLRPYVFVFLAVYLAAAGRDLGLGRALAFTGWAWVVAFVAEYSSTRNGFPFGLYHYTEATRGQELFLANVPFMDSLSFTFLAYASFALARLCLRRSRGAAIVLLSAVLMMLLDVVIDPIAVRGDRWFLGRIFYYAEGGVYFGVPVSNFLGWALVGGVIVGGFCAFFPLAERARPGSDGWLEAPRPGAALYYGVVAFNLVVTGWIGEPLLLALGVLLHGAIAAAFWLRSSAGFAGVTLGGGIGRGATPPSEVRS